jgi:RNA polymerase-binding transcription factor DksA
MADPADLALHSIEQAETIREMRRQSRQAKELLGLAITACRLCGEHIGYERKKAIPWADLCIDCAREDEIKRKGGVR